MIFPLGILFLTSVSSTIVSEKLHNRMTSAQVTEIFHVPTHDLVPDHEIIQFDIPMIRKRDASPHRKMVIRAIGKNWSVFVSPANKNLATNNTEVYIANVDKNDHIIYDRITEGLNNIGNLWENPESKTTLIIRRDVRGQLKMDGFIGSRNLVVRSLPESISSSLIQDHTSDGSSTKKSAYHVVYETPNNHNDTMRIKSLAMSKRSVLPSIDSIVLSPKIMVVVDKETYYGIHGGNMNKLLAYVIAYWNSVDLLYRKARQPLIRFNLAKIIISNNTFATPYIRYSTNDDSETFAQPAWKLSEKFFFKKERYFPPDSYDAVITMIKNNMFDNDFNEVLAVATLGGICRRKEFNRLVTKVAHVTDDGLFGGVFPTARAFSYLLSDPTGIKEQDKIRFVPATEKNYPQFKDDLRSLVTDYYSRRKNNCMMNTLESSKPVPKIFAADLLSRDVQCTRLGFGKSCYNGPVNQSACSAIYCHPDANTKSKCVKYSEFIPVDGTMCDDGMFCVDGKCLNDI